jgi:hypothetical protein
MPNAVLTLSEPLVAVVGVDDVAVAPVAVPALGQYQVVPPLTKLCIWLADEGVSAATGADPNPAKVVKTVTTIYPALVRNRWMSRLLTLDTPRKMVGGVAFAHVGTPHKRSVSF